jgi:hypothetical protein
MGELVTIGRVKFADVPDYFLERYDAEIAAWANNFARIGPVKSFMLREGGFADPSPDPEQGAELLVVKLIARLSRKGVEIEPLTERDCRLIARHVEKMQRNNVPARARLTEPPRPWLPFMPTIEKAEKIGANNATDGEGRKN